MLTTVPWPSRLLIATLPPWRVTTTRTSASPMPVPGRLRAARPRASSCQTCPISSAGMPVPVSATSSSSQWSSSLARTSTVSPGTENFTALEIRFWMAMNSRSRSPSTCGRGHGACGTDSRRTRSRAPGISAAASATSYSRPGRSTGAVSICWVSRSASLRRSLTRRVIRSACADTLARAADRPWAAQEPAAAPACSMFASPARMAVSGFFSSWSSRMRKRSRSCVAVAAVCCTAAAVAAAAAMTARRRIMTTTARTPVPNSPASPASRLGDTIA